MSGGKLRFLEHKVQSLASIFLFYFFIFGSGSSSGMMLLKVSMLFFKLFKSMSSMENQLALQGTELCACSLHSRCCGLWSSSWTGSSGIWRDPGWAQSWHFQTKEQRARTWADWDLFRHRKSPFVVEASFKKGKMKPFIALLQIMSYWITFMVQPPLLIFKTIIYISKSHLF